MSLLSTLLIFQMGMVWQSKAVDPDGRLSNILENFSLVLIMGTSVLGLGVEAVMFRERYVDLDAVLQDGETVVENPLESTEELTEMKDLADVVSAS